MTRPILRFAGIWLIFVGVGPLVGAIYQIRGLDDPHQLTIAWHNLFHPPGMQQVEAHTPWWEWLLGAVALPAILVLVVFVLWIFAFFSWFYAMAVTGLACAASSPLVRDNRLYFILCASVSAIVFPRMFLGFVDHHAVSLTSKVVAGAVAGALCGLVANRLRPRRSERLLPLRMTFREPN